MDDAVQILNSVTRIKIRKDNSSIFTLKEIEVFSKIYNVDVPTFCADILNLSKPQINDLLSGRKKTFRCASYIEHRKKFFEQYQDEFMKSVIQYQVPRSSSKTFSLEELSEMSREIGLNLSDLAKNILGISQNMLSRLKNGEFKSVSSNKYQQNKIEYITSISEQILNDVLNKRLATDFSANFTYQEIKEYSENTHINIRDFLTYVLGIKKFSQYDGDFKKITEEDNYNSRVYKVFKEKKLDDISKKMLDSIISERIKSTGKFTFAVEEIEKIAQENNINIRDLMVHVLGKSEQLYYDYKANRIQRISSNKYKEEKEEILQQKREQFMKTVNPNVRKYYSADDLENLAEAMDISMQDLVMNIMEKSRQDYYRISHNYRNGKRVFVGENKSVELPPEYCKNNIKKIIEILQIAVRSAIVYMKSNGYNCEYLYKDLFQEGYLYLANHGNPLDENNNPRISMQQLQYENSHGSILYKKAYYNAISNISKLMPNEILGETFDINTKTKGEIDEIPDDAELFISNLSQDENELKILRYFSKNLYDEDTVKDACEKFKVTPGYISNMLSKLREKLSDKDIRHEENER